MGKNQMGGVDTSNLLVYDLEILKAIPDEVGARRPGIEYCEGWDDKRGMGVAVVCAYDAWEERYRVFTGHKGLQRFTRLAQRKYTIGFNSISFDDKVLQASGYEVKTQWDLKRAAQVHEGYPVEVYVPELGLQALASANTLGMKSFSGELAPILWQQGEYGEVIDYCLQDVKLTWKLVQLVRSGYPLINPINSSDTLQLQIGYYGHQRI